MSIALEMSMSLGFREWRLSLLTTLGLGTALACGGSTEKNPFDGGTGGTQSPQGTSISGQTASVAGSGGGRTVGGATGEGGSVGGSMDGVVEGGAGNAGTGSPPGRPRHCQNPRPLRLELDSGADPSRAEGARSQSQAIVIRPEPGWIECDGGWLHRGIEASCPSSLPRAKAPFVLPENREGYGCTKDSECTDAPNGYCELNAPPSYGSSCRYGCTEDSQCGEGSVCICGDPVGTCVKAGCAIDSDCDSGLCVATLHNICAEFYDVACAQPEDECLVNGDCAQGQECWVGEEARSCEDQPACGRPFLVSGEARTASAQGVDNGWSCDVGPDCARLDAGQRAKLAAHYTEIGLMEHASVAAFARFILELLAFGAPGDLVRDAQRALADEITHAELCFGLARAYGGEPVSAGVLPMEGALDARSRFEIVRTAILEACIGETVAAVEARLAADAARDPEVRRVLRRIAEDEARHAELGWRFIHWVLRSSPPDLALELESTLRALVAEGARPSERRIEAPLDRALAEHGYVSASLRERARELAFSELIVPWTSALLAQPLAA